MTLGPNTPTLEAVLDQLFYASDELDYSLLKKLMNEYPQYQVELADFLRLWSQTPMLDDSALGEDGPPAEEVARLQSVVQARLYAEQHRKQQQESSRAAAALAQLKGAKALKATSQAIGFGCATGLLGEVLEGIISDVPRVVYARLAKHFRCTYDDVLATLNAQMSSYSYKAADKPLRPRKETWIEAISRLDIPATEKQSLFELASRDCRR
jgi:hypothetical protein